MAADVKKGDKWIYTRKGGTMTLKGFYTVIYAPEDYPSIESEAIHASYEGIVPDYGQACDVAGWEWMFVREKTATQISPHNFQVDVVYTNAASETSGQSLPRNPSLIPADVSFFTVSNQEKIDRDKDGNAITNSANEPPDPPLMEDDLWMGMRVVKYYSGGEYNPNLYADYKRSTNSGTFNVKGKSGTYQFAEGTVKFIDESMEEVEVGKEMYCKVTRVFHIRADDLKWKRRVLDEGYTVITGSNIKPAAESAKAQRIKTRELSDSTLPFQNNMDEEDYNPYIETPTSEPTLLDGSGGILAHGGTPVYLEKETLTAKSYTGIV